MSRRRRASGTFSVSVSLVRFRYRTETTFHSFHFSPVDVDVNDTGHVFPGSTLHIWRCSLFFLDVFVVIVGVGDVSRSVFRGESASRREWYGISVLLLMLMVMEMEMEGRQKAKKRLDSKFVSHPTRPRTTLCSYFLRIVVPFKTIGSLLIENDDGNFLSIPTKK